MTAMPPGPGGYMQSGTDSTGYPSPNAGGYPSQPGGYPQAGGGYPAMGLQSGPYQPQQQARRLDPDQMPSPVRI